MVAQKTIARFLDRMCLALRGSWTMAPLRYASWIAPPRPPPWRNPRKGRDQILTSCNLGLKHCACPCKPGEKRGTMLAEGVPFLPSVLGLLDAVWRLAAAAATKRPFVAKGNGEVATNEAKIRVVGRLPTRLRNFADRTGELNLKILIASTNTRKNGPIVHKSSPNLSSATQSLHPTQVKARGPLALLALLIELRNKSEGFNRVLSVFNAPSSF